MKRHWLTYEQVKEKHPDCYIDLRYIPIDATYPNHEHVPVATAPGILVWPDKISSQNDDNGTNCIEIYWLRNED